MQPASVQGEPGPGSPVAETIGVARYLRIRGFTEQLVRPLSAEDCGLQSMPDASPTKWHLAHTTWFFETIVLARLDEPPFDPTYGYLFNSYYEGVGPRHARTRRGMLSRPSLEQVLAYRRDVDERMARLIERVGIGDHADLAPLVELGLQHEQQHQELILTDIKHALSESPLTPAYRGTPVDDGPHTPARRLADGAALRARRFVEQAGGIASIGHDGVGFAFDNEGPRHEVLVHPHALADRLVTAGEVMDFIADGGYTRPELWLSDGWAAAQGCAWTAPLYWKREDQGFVAFTLAGVVPVDPREPACHLSFYEADAVARWAGARLPTEAEWERHAATLPVRGNFVEGGRLHPTPPTPDSERSGQMFGDVWEWTASAYLPYPRFRPWAGAVGEYNGKFMSGQMVLRGGSCATPATHIRASYRNFFPPSARWQFSGLRLARDL